LITTWSPTARHCVKLTLYLNFCICIDPDASPVFVRSLYNV